MAQAAAALKSIMSSAAETFAGIFGFLSPIMGPAAAGPAAGGEAAVLSVQGMVASAQGGMLQVPGNMLVNVHENESIIPADIAGPMRSYFGGGAEGGGSSRGDTHVHISSHDAEGFDRKLSRSNNTIVRSIQKAIRDGNMKLRR